MISEEKKQELQEQYISSGCWGDETFGKALKRLAEQYGDKIALKDEQLSLSFKQWDEITDRGAAIFKSEGYKKGDKVVIQLPNSVLFFLVCFSLFKLGVVPVFALPAHREREISGFIEKTNASAYIVAEKHLGFSYREMAESCVRNTGCKVYYENDIMEKLLNAEAKGNDFSEEGISSFETAVLLVSGGTTGIPKLIPRTHADYLYDAKTFADTVGMNEETVFLAAIPVSHNFTFANPGVIGTALSGGCSVISRNGAADEILDIIESEKVTITSLVPSILELCAEMAGWDEDKDINSLQIIMVGGAVLLDSVLEKAQRYLKCSIRQVFGTAEGLNTITPADMPSELIAGCQGVPISEFDEMRITDSEGEILPVNTEGELIIRGPYTIRNYYNNPEADMEAFYPDGFYRTGDKAYIDENGAVHICGRVREQINRAGEKIMPYELDKILKRHEGIQDSAVIGIPDKELGNKICACIVFAGKTLELGEIREYMLDKGIATFKLPDCILGLDRMPLTAVGKVDKKELLRIYNERNNI